jgi:hypothetical protein
VQGLRSHWSEICWGNIIPWIELGSWEIIWRAILGGLLELGVHRLTGSVTATKFVFGGGSSREGSNFEGWNQGKPFLGFLGFGQ